jgi:hypothetical protein
LEVLNARGDRHVIENPVDSSPDPELPFIRFNMDVGRPVDISFIEQLLNKLDNGSFTGMDFNIIC